MKRQGASHIFLQWWDPRYPRGTVARPLQKGPVFSQWSGKILPGFEPWRHGQLAARAGQSPRIARNAELVTARSFIIAGDFRIHFETDLREQANLGRWIVEQFAQHRDGFFVVQ